MIPCDTITPASGRPSHIGVKAERSRLRVRACVVGDIMRYKLPLGDKRDRNLAS